MNDTMETMNAQPEKQRNKTVSCMLQVALWVVFPLLICLYILYAVETQSGFVYKAVSGTPVEEQALKVLPMIWRHKTFLERQSMNVDLTVQERAASRQLFKRMERVRPTHCFKLHSGEFLFGRPTDKTDAAYTVSYFDQTYRKERAVSSAEIESVTPLAMGHREFSPKNIRFLLKFERLQHYYLEPYLIVADVPFASAMELYGILAMFEEQFRSHFGPLIGQSEGGIVQIAYFSSRESLVNHLSGTISTIPNASAFFSKTTNTLYLHANQDAVNPNSAHMFQSILLDSATDKRERRQALFKVIRHEGAHHLVSSMGALDGWEPVPFWIEEGLAQYCETGVFGQIEPQKIAFLRHARETGRFLEWETLLRASQEAVSELPEDEAQLYYAQSWLLFRYLMVKQRRPLFMSFVLKIRDRGNWLASDQLELANTLRTTWTKIDSDLTRLLGPKVASEKNEPSG